MFWLTLLVLCLFDLQKDAETETKDEIMEETKEVNDMHDNRSNEQSTINNNDRSKVNKVHYILGCK